MIYLIGICLAMAGVIYFLFKRTSNLKDELDTEKSRADQYFQAMKNTKDLAIKAAEIDKNIEVKKNERKNLSKGDKIKLANSRNSTG